jgi:hypothetical protein
MPRLELHFAEIARSKDLASFETSTECFDRIEFARAALELLRPERTTVAICEGVAGVRLEAGRQWGRPAGARWAVLSIPPRASRRAIAAAVAGLARDADPYALDVLSRPESPSPS